jgi:hypothetical protein
MAALVLCNISKAIVTVMAVLSGLGLTVALIVLAITGTISVVAAIVLAVIGVPLVGTVVYWLTALLAFVPLGIAKLLDRQIVSDWIDNENMGGY